MSTLMMPAAAATMTTMTNTSPIAVTQPKAPAAGVPGGPGQAAIVAPTATAVAPPVAVSTPPNNGIVATDSSKMGIINNNKQGRVWMASAATCVSSRDEVALCGPADVVDIVAVNRLK